MTTVEKQQILDAAYAEAQAEAVIEMAESQNTTVEEIESILQRADNVKAAKLGTKKLDKLNSAQFIEVADLAGEDPKAASLLLNTIVKRIKRDKDKPHNIVKRNRLRDALDDITELLVAYDTPVDHYLITDSIPLLKKAVTATTRS